MPRKAEADLRQSEESLAEAARMRAEFVAVVSDELRTPLTNILGYAEMLVEGDVGELSLRQLKALAVVDRNAHRLLGLVDDLLLLARLGRVELGQAHEAADVAELVEHAVAELWPSLVGRDLTLAVTVAEDVGAVDGRRDQLKRVLVNLLANAVKHTPDGGGVIVTASRCSTHVTLRVADTGIGIDMADQQQVFEPFVGTRFTRRFAGDGAGLGLATVRAIVDAHDGGITIVSAPGAGTSVSVDLPVRAAPAAGGPMRIAEARPELDDEKRPA